ncbi:MAG TPA: hypothetical protein VFZ66_17105 [Herpetosiphonaceae bacterium]
MHPGEYGRGPWFRRGPRGGFWLLPLLIGIGLGALFFGGPRGPWLGFDGFGREYGPGYRQQAPQAAPQAGAERAAPQAEQAPAAPDARGHGREWHGFGERRHFAPFFFPFGGLRLIVPLLLIGAGLWLLSGRRRGPRHWGGPGGPGHWGGPGGAQYSHPAGGPQAYQAQPPAPPQQQQGQPYTPPQPAPPSSQEPGAPPEPPATGETRIL